MDNYLKKIEQEIAHFKVKNAQDLESFRQQYISKKGKIAELMGKLKTMPITDRKKAGRTFNTLKKIAQQRFTILKTKLAASTHNTTPTATDLTLPPLIPTLGAAHPLSKLRNEMVDILQSMGFKLAQGPEIEDDWHNFAALNFPENHPARDMQDTFFLLGNKGSLLRTHTSSVQVRIMENSAPPIRIIAPGRVYRRDAISARAHCMFHQLEGLYVAKDANFSQLKGTLLHLFTQMFGPQTRMRLRTSYFPFTVPSLEVDITCLLCKGKGCSICKQTGWVELGGAGMVDPNVLTNCDIDAKKYKGFAFGVGLERIAMLCYQINDLRLFTQNDIRFLQQFR